MTIIDARSGKTVKVGETITYPPTIKADGTVERSSGKLEAFTPGWFNGQARVRTYEGKREYVSTIQVPIRGIFRRVAVLPS